MRNLWRKIRYGPEYLIWTAIWPLLCWVLGFIAAWGLYLWILERYT